MKTFLAIISFAFLVGIILSIEVSAGPETNGAYTKIEHAVAVNDIRGIIQILPEVENLWPQEPEAYFRSVKQAANVLGGAPTNPDAKQSLVTLFDKILDKRSPTNDEQAIAYFDLKSKTILYYLNFNEIKSDKSRLIAIAKFIGEVRSRRIPNYANRGTGLPGREILHQAGVRDAHSITNPVLKQAYEKAVKDNKQDLMMNDLQRTLRSADISFHLLRNCSRYPSTDPKNDGFIKEIISSANLTEGEAMKLGALPRQINGIASRSATNETTGVWQK